MIEKLTNHRLLSTKFCLAVVVLLFPLLSLTAVGQTYTAVGTLTLKGNVYGGGAKAAINTGNAVIVNAGDSLTNPDLTRLSVTDPTDTASVVTLIGGKVANIFGGGAEGRSFGQTNVVLESENAWVTGNIFGAGEGNRSLTNNDNGAGVLGGSAVLMKNGQVDGHIYGGADAATTVGGTRVEIKGQKASTSIDAVFGGSRVADIYGHSFVYANGKAATTDIKIGTVYGGNDISGNITPATTATEPNWTWAQEANLKVPAGLSIADATATPNLTEHPADANHVDSTWNAYVYVSKPASKKLEIGTLYVGGNGDYDYTSNEISAGVPNPNKGLSLPVLDKGYVQVEGGVFGALYGGGNNATINLSTDICLINSTDVTGYKDSNNQDVTYQFGYVFGGNNKAEMAIRPNWYLQQASIDNLYSGGNAGAMTYYNPEDEKPQQDRVPKGGIFLPVESSAMTINNVYGGCRLADVNPGHFGEQAGSHPINQETLLGATFQAGYAARVLITDGIINNVYGGNDISGVVYYGSMVDIRTSINNDIYGAGNGSYAYTDKDTTSEYYYAPGSNSAKALNNHRPNAEKTWVHVSGTQAKPTYIGGAIYCGGNSATLRSVTGDLATATARLQIGSYVIADQVFQGSNGINMVQPSLLAQYADNNFSSLDLTQSAQFEEYMKGVEVAIKPVVAFDSDYEAYSSQFGSLYCGGNVGSMSADGTFNIDFLNTLVIYDKLVGGCNSANVEKTAYNAYHQGGLITNTAKKVQLNIAGLKLNPKRMLRDANGLPTGLEANKYDDATVYPHDATLLKGANIYGGCYASGYINGNVEINISENAIDPSAATQADIDKIAANVFASTLSCYGGGYGEETEIWGDVTINITDNGQIIKAYGGGEMGIVGKINRDANNGELKIKSETFGDQTITGYEYGIAKQGSDITTYMYDVAKAYQTVINLNNSRLATTEYNVVKVYGGGFQGVVTGNTTVNLDKSFVYDAFGGACNADIYGASSIYVGKNGQPMVAHNVYGANDFGGQIIGMRQVTVDNAAYASGPGVTDAPTTVTTQSYVEYNSGSIAGSIYGGSCGSYYYFREQFTGKHDGSTVGFFNAIADTKANSADYYNNTKLVRRDDDGKIRHFTLPTLQKRDMSVAAYNGTNAYGTNSFVNVVSQSTLAADYVTGGIYGAGQGLKGRMGFADQGTSYVRLAAADPSKRNVKELSPSVFGAGYCSITLNSLVDAYSGYFNNVFGGCFGVTAIDKRDLGTEAYNELIDAHDSTWEEEARLWEQNYHDAIYMGYRSAVRLYTMDNKNMDLFGAGANSGNEECGVVLYGGQAHDVYGASLDEGYTFASNVTVPANSTSKVNAIYGGGKGKIVKVSDYSQTTTSAAYAALSETDKALWSDAFACDASNTFVSFKGAGARVNEAIYGGNNASRAARNTHLEITVPVMNPQNQLINVFGAGKGELTMASFTNIDLDKGAQVLNAFGGGDAGRVYDDIYMRGYLMQDSAQLPYTTVVMVSQNAQGLGPASGVLKGNKFYFNEKEFTRRYPDANYATVAAVNTKFTDPATIAAGVIGGRWPGFMRYVYLPESWRYEIWMARQGQTYGHGTETVTIPAVGIPGVTSGDYAYVAGRQETKTRNYYWPLAFDQPWFLYGLGETEYGIKNTNIHVNEGAVVSGNVYGAGLGEQATVAGSTEVRLMGGTIAGDAYGGGLGGSITQPAYVELYQQERVTPRTTVYIGGGSVRNVFGGGKNGDCLALTDVVVGDRDSGKGVFAGTTTAKTVTIADAPASRNTYTEKVFAGGDPTVLRSLYGGGENGRVNGISHVTINQGHIGFKYENDEYVENVDLKDAEDALLDQNGNVFGAGFGESAKTFFSNVDVYGGYVRNSVYGGGEIATVGMVKEGFSVPNASSADQIRQNIWVPGRTHVKMFNGQVNGNVFGGGRGFSYDLNGNTVTGQEQYSDGYIFGTTDVEILGGIVGTDKTLENGDGNVFGGGNIGYIYSDAVKYTGTTDPTKISGRYYTHYWKCKFCNAISPSINMPLACSNCNHYHNRDINPDKAVYTYFEPCKKDGTVISGVTVNPTTGVADYSGVAAGVVYEELSEDSRVVVSPYAQVIDDAGISFNAVAGFVPAASFAKGEYVPSEYMNTLPNKTAGATQWAKLDDSGVNIRNAVFAGGNVSAGSDQVYANTVTVYGNATATLYDIFFRDFITIGTDRVGGLYGDGNLTFVDGYRELNISNYGTDYYGMSERLTLDEYKKLNDRERAYFELQYECQNDINTTIDGVHYQYAKGAKIGEDDYKALPETLRTDTYWEPAGFCSIYAGRMMNTIQRADFCGVFGSRMVMEGARDRVPEVVDYKNYTINRVGEVSLNRAVYPGYTEPDPSTVAGWDEDSQDRKTYETYVHGNYFGMYSIVNYLGALTSDVSFGDVRRTDATDPKYKLPVRAGDATSGYGKDSYYEWKEKHYNDRTRNNAISHNKVSLASGVYLELVSEEASSNGSAKNWGLITGVVELDLLNVMPGLGGGYVYARNEHGVRTENGIGTGKHDNLSKYNANAVNNTKYSYDDSAEALATRKPFETSGNFVHNTKQIIDNCFPYGNMYSDLPYGTSPAHYWYIKGEFYIYDQYVSAYTGSSVVYTENIELPLTITLGSRGKLDLVNVQPNLYAFWANRGDKIKLGSSESTQSVILNNVTYTLNDPITYWDYTLLSDADKLTFVPVTYTATKDFLLDRDDASTLIKKGSTWLPDPTPDSPSDPFSYEYFIATQVRIPAGGTIKTVYDPEEVAADDPLNPTYEGENVLKFIHISNEVSHDNGYAVGVALDNPMLWNNWYSPVDGSGTWSKINTRDYTLAGNPSDYMQGPTYTPNTAGVYGQRQYEVGDFLTQTAYNSYHAIAQADIDDLVNRGRAQATVEQAYVSTQPVTYTLDGVMYNLQAGVGISTTEYGKLGAATQSRFDKAVMCTNTYVVDATANEYVYVGELISATRLETLVQLYVTNMGVDEATARLALANFFDGACICTEAGLYGGKKYVTGVNYSALDSWSTLSAEDRVNFDYNYDAFDVLSESDYPAEPNGINELISKTGNGKQYDGYMDDTNTGWLPGLPVYSISQPVDYEAYWKGDAELPGITSFTYTDKSGTVHTVEKGQDHPMDRTVYESIPNEKAYWAQFTITATDVQSGPKVIYIVKQQFVQGEQPYLVGQVVNEQTYATINSTHYPSLIRYEFTTPGNYYFCREAYTVNEKGEGHAIDAVNFSGNRQQTTYTTIGLDTEVPQGTIILETKTDTNNDYVHLTNKQTNFAIIGRAPVETTTLYVSRESNIDNLSKDRIMTVIIQYQYDESDESGMNIEQITEKHIINIHIQFMSGTPTIGLLKEPSIVLPHQTVGLKQPSVSQGAYEILGGGWEIYSNENDAKKHKNGKSYVNNATPMYWYQNGYYVAYYAKTYLGKTFSNAVQFKVANYHDLNAVMNHPEYMYIDHADVDRNPKIYLDNRTCYESDGTTLKNKSEIDLLRDLFTQSLETTKHTVNIETHISDNGGNLLYYELDTNGDPKTDKDASGMPLHTTTTPNNYPIVLPIPTEVPVLEDNVRNCRNLEFILSSDVAAQQTWTAIGNTTTGCFGGNVHGNGFTISNLGESLFGRLCGEVHNLGVTGSFEGSGIADAGDNTGLVSNCWIYTTGTPSATAIPVYGGSGEAYNCYYPEQCGYNPNDNLTIPTEIKSRPFHQFYNGKVAYDLNGYYLLKRYHDKKTTDGSGKTRENGKMYYYWKQDAEGEIDKSATARPATAYYTEAGRYEYNQRKFSYVESLYADGDFIYRHAVVPEEDNVRKYGMEHYPIWPDDYLFFGQMLTYGYDEANRPYSPWPTHVAKTLPTVDATGNTVLPMTSDNLYVADGRLKLDETKMNVVCRAPAYFRNNTLQTVYFNPYAVLTDKINPSYPGIDSWMLGSHIHKGLTAIDLTGLNDAVEYSGATLVDKTSNWTLGGPTQKFFAPMLDYTAIMGIRTMGVSQNLLVYAHENEEHTSDILTNYFNDPAYAELTESSTVGARSVAALEATAISGITGHLVSLTGGVGSTGKYVARSDHFLVDLQDFNAPIAYTFDTGKRMWYQRKPSYVDATKGWEGISLPFESELVTTSSKGEITHFYQFDASEYTRGYNSGHEYWLREFAGVGDTEVTAGSGVYEAEMAAPLAVVGGDTKTDANTFLWDYYYDQFSSQDANEDEYQKTYYQTARTYPNYPFAQAVVPYIVGFPGSRYYEFDLSGSFVPQHADGSINKLSAQTVTFASKAGAEIAVSDTEISAYVGDTDNQHDGYVFVPTYLNHTSLSTLQADKCYVLNADGSRFVDLYDQTGTDKQVKAFRPYVKLATATSLTAPAKALVFGSATNSQLGEDEPIDEPGDAFSADLYVHTKRGKIIVESSLEDDTLVRIVNATGLVLRRFDIRPGDKVETEVDPGVYMVNGFKYVVR